MAGTIDKLNQLEDIARLRRVQKRAPGDRDLSAVRANLERRVGATVSRRLAARLLGVSHSALTRWIRSGDLPVVYSPAGRLEIPVPALIELHEQVSGLREEGDPPGHFLEAAFSVRRQRAQRSNLGSLVSAPAPVDAGHGGAERRGLAYHRALARQLDQEMIAEALHRVWKLREEGKLDPVYAEQWEALLGRPLEEVRRVIGEDSPRGRDLRQSSPLAGMLSEPERRRILEELSDQAS